MSAPLLLVHGEADRIVPASHSQSLASQSPPAELWLRPGDGHLSVLDAYDDGARLAPGPTAWFRDVRPWHLMIHDNAAG